MNDLVKAALTPHQLRIAQGLLNGLSNKEIAKKLGLTASQVNSAVRYMCERYGIEVAETGRNSSKRILLARKLMLA